MLGLVGLTCLEGVNCPYPLAQAGRVHSLYLATGSRSECSYLWYGGTVIQVSELEMQARLAKLLSSEKCISKSHLDGTRANKESDFSLVTLLEVSHFIFSKTVLRFSTPSLTTSIKLTDHRGESKAKQARVSKPTSRLFDTSTPFTLSPHHHAPQQHA